MLHLVRYPAPPLDEFVDCLWLLAGAQTPRQERILPSGTVEIVVNLHEDEMRIHNPARPDEYNRLSGATVSGTYSTAFICDARQHESIVGVHFKPGGAFPFLGVPANELSDTHVDLSDLWGLSARELREQLCGTTAPAARLRTLETSLLQRLGYGAGKGRPMVSRALAMFGPAGTGATVRDVVRELGVSDRHFIRVFRTEIGLTPKRFCRLLRFQRVRALADGVEGVRPAPSQRAGEGCGANWAGLGSTCGYSDQSHLINDFREFAGVTPAEYLRGKQAGGRSKENHLPLSSPVNFFLYGGDMERDNGYRSGNGIVREVP